jgi:hypothetical protein
MAHIKLPPIGQVEADKMVKLLSANKLNLDGPDDYECGHCNVIVQSWLGESGQIDKWLFCLTAAMIAAHQERL